MEPVLDFDRETPRTPHTPGSGRALLSGRKKDAASPFGDWLRADLATVPQAVHRRVKCYNDRSDTRAPENEKEFTANLEKTANKVSEFAEVLNGKEQDLHQRQAQIGEIEAKHTRFAEELTSLRDLLQGEVQTARESYSKIAPISDPKRVAACCKSLLNIELGLNPLEKIYQELAPLLAAPLHHKALEFYKKQKKECESLALIPTVQERIKKLETIVEAVDQGVREVLPQLEGKFIALKEQTELLCLELVDFTLTASNLIKTTPIPQTGRMAWLWSLVITPQAVLPEVTEEQNICINALQEKLQELIRRILPQRQEADTEQALSKLVQFYLGQARKESLQAEDSFRRHPIVSMLAYGEIKNEREALETIAKALAKLSKDIKELRDDIVCGKKLPKEQEEYTEILAGLRIAINNELIKLRNHTLSKRIHAGWYYVARLLVKAHDVDLFLKQLKSLSSKSFAPYAKAVGDLFAYLDPQEEELRNNPDYETSLIATERLYSCLASASSLARPQKEQTSSEKLRTKLYDLIEQVLCRAGMRTLEPAHREESLADRIFLHEPLISFIEGDEAALGILPEAFLNLLIKGFVRAMYYSSHAAFDPQLDLVLYTLRNAPCYKKAFQNTIGKAKNFKLHLDNYLAKNDMDQYEKELRLMTKALFSLHKNPFATGHEKLFRYLEAKHLLQEIDNIGLASQQQQLRRAWLKEKCAFLFVEVEQHLSTYFSDHELKPLLEESLFGSNPDDASEKVREYLQALCLDQLPTDQTLLVVLQGWALSQLMKNADKEIPHGGYLLNSLFEGYFTNEAKRCAWRNLHGVGFMESALYKATKRYPSAVVNSRDAFHQDVYDGVIPIYDAFCRLYSEISELPNQQAENQLMEMHKNFSLALPVEVHPPEADTHIGVARWCVIDATAKYAALLHNRFLELYVKQPNERFLEESDDHKAACALRDSLINLFSEGMPEEPQAKNPDSTINLVRQYRKSTGVTLTLYTTPFHLLPNFSQRDEANE